MRRHISKAIIASCRSLPRSPSVPAVFPLQYRRFASNSFLGPSCEVLLPSDSSLVEHDGNRLTVGQWEMALEEKFGTGTHRLRRALFRELCDEMRGEIDTKPPPPLSGWKVGHIDGTDAITFSLDRSFSKDGYECFAIGRLYFKDPPSMAAHAGFIDNHFVDIFVERNGVVIHFHVAFVEKNLEVKNIKVFKKNALSELLGEDEIEKSTLAATAKRIEERKHLIYDGPCIHHLEEDFYNELHDVLVCAGVDAESFVPYAVQWISYLEHVEYLRWNLSVQDSVLSADKISIDELLTEVEVDIASTPLDTWQREENRQ